MPHWQHADDDEAQSAAPPENNARLGLALFSIYAAAYAGFVWANAFAPEWMARRPWAGVNVAVWYGFGLLFGALAVALVYSWLAGARNRS